MACGSPLTAPQASVGRRTFFQWLTYGLSFTAAAVLSFPLLGYFLGVRKRDVLWVPLGEVGRFPVNETRLHTFDNPLRQPWDGMTGSHRGLRSQPGGRRAGRAGLPRLRGQLRPSGLPGDLVPTGGAVYVPLPRRRLLREWRARVGPAAARPVPLPMARAQRTTRGPGAALPDFARHSRENRLMRIANQTVNPCGRNSKEARSADPLRASFLLDPPPARRHAVRRHGRAFMSLDGKPQTYRVVGVNADGDRITVVRAMLKETAETIAKVLVIGQVYERTEIEPEDDESTAR